MKQEISKQVKMREAAQKRIHLMEDQKADVDVQKETLKAQITGLEKGKLFIMCKKTHTFQLDVPGQHLVGMCDLCLEKLCCKYIFNVTLLLYRPGIRSETGRLRQKGD